MSEAASVESSGSIAGFLSRLLRHPRLLLTVFCLLLWAPGIFSLPPLDRDESRFAQASKQMLETGDFVDIRLGNAPRYKKPVGIYWMQSAATTAADLGRTVHDRIWTYRLTSLLGALAAVWLTFWCARAFASVEAAFLSAMLMGATLLLAGEASIATTDAVLLAAILAAQGVFLRIYKASRENRPLSHPVEFALLGWAAIGVGVLVKGPVAPAVPLLTLAALSLWDRDARWLQKLRPLSGIILVLLIVVPWAIAIALRSRGQFYEQSIGVDFAAKMAGGQESHGAVPGYYLALMTLTLWPVTLFLIPAIAGAVRARAEPAVRFLLCWIVPCWLMFELVPTKLPHYVLPVYPALAILAAVWALGKMPKKTVFDRVLFWAAPVQFLAAAAALTAAVVVLPGIYGSGILWWQTALVALFFTFCIVSVAAYARRLALTAAFAAFAAALVLYPTVTAGVAPSLEKLWISPRAAAAVKTLSRPGDPPPAAVGYHEPSLLFLLGTKTRLANARDAADVGAEAGGLVLVDSRQVPLFLGRLAEREADAHAVGTVDGFNYSKGRTVRLRIFRVTPVREWTPPQE
jgi:hypothetical protein